MRIGVIDTETTGADPTKDKIVTLFYGVMHEDGSFSEKYNFLFNPGVEISPEATEVHGITNEKAISEGIAVKDHAAAFSAIFDLIRRHSGNTPLVAYNASFDFTVLNNVALEHQIPIDISNLFIFDPFVVDKKFDKYRSGSRKQTHVAAHYGIEVDESKAHNAAYDCYLAGAIAQKLLNSETAQDFTKEYWMSQQKIWKKDQANSLQSYLRNKYADNEIMVNPEWPIRSY